MFTVSRVLSFLLIIVCLSACGAAEKQLVFNNCKIAIPDAFVEVNNGLSGTEYIRQDLYSLALIQLNETTENESERLKGPEFKDVFRKEINNLVFWKYQLAHPNPDIKISAILVEGGGETLKLQSNNIDELILLVEQCFDSEVLQILANTK